MSLSQRGRKLFRATEAEGFWGNPAQANKALARLNQKGWLERLDRGTYMIVPLEAGTDRRWTEDSLAVATFLVPDGAAAYWSAMCYWGWTTQLPGTVTFLAPSQRRNSQPTILGVRYHFVRVRQDRVFGIAESWEGQLRIRVTDKERTILDILDRTDLSGGIAEVARALEEAWPSLDLDRLTGYMKRFASGTVPKRLGLLVERLPLATEGSGRLEQWRRLVGKGVSALERGGAEDGRIVSRWKLRVNTSGFDAERGMGDS